jgi:hypothetical protein
VPPAASHLKPGKVAAKGCRAKDGIGVLLELFIGDSFVYGDLLGG